MNRLQHFLSQYDLMKISALDNQHVIEILAWVCKLCQPAKVSVIGDDQADLDYVRELALKNGEETSLTMEEHTVHFDSYRDQARDRAQTKVLLSSGKHLSSHINTIERDTGLAEIFGMMDGIMQGKEMLVRFFSLGPQKSRFTIPAMQISDSAYVIHSENLLYRPGYQVFQNLNGSPEFFYFLHTVGELNKDGHSKNDDQRRIYIDLDENRVFSINNQYAGNSIGLKKHALRLAINKANHEDWLTEHMFIMGVHPPGKKRTSYFSGAFPSACGKTSTAMLPGQTIIGDDIAYLRAWDDGSCHAVNIESGVFGIITDVNPVDDPLIYDCLTTQRELIFSNVLINNKNPYWIGMGKPLPESGMNHYGKYFIGKTDADGRKIPAAHKNARYTIRISDLENVDPEAENPEGVPIQGIIYGGRDSDTNVPVCQSLDWDHGVFYGACLESETTAATIGQEGVRKHSPMANFDFLVVPLGKYIQNHLDFGARLKQKPLIFSTNYFLKDTDGNYLLDKADKQVWILWAEARIHGELDAIETPIGYIPCYDDLEYLFESVMHKPFSLKLYQHLFSIRINNFLEKLERIEKNYANENMPDRFIKSFQDQKARLIASREQYKTTIITPCMLAVNQSVLC